MTRPSTLLALLVWLSSLSSPSLHSSEIHTPTGDPGDRLGAGQPLEGSFRAWVEGRGGEVPFGLHFSRDLHSSSEVPSSSDPSSSAGHSSSDDERLHAWIENGLERVEVARVEETEDGATLHFDPYESRIELQWDETGTRLIGAWIRDRGDANPDRLPFGAVPGTDRRFPPSDAASDEGGGHGAEDIAGTWRVQFQRESEHAVGVFAPDPRHGAGPTDVVGTFLTTLGDYRYLAGSYEDGLLRLSVFDGAHAFLFAARTREDGSLSGDFWSRDSWHDTWTATREEGVALDDPFLIGKAKDGVAWGSLTYSDLEGRARRLDDPEFQGKARLIVLFGTWCPNCNDETRYLVELDRRYRSRGLSVLGLAFEFGDDPARYRDVVRRYGEHHRVGFPLLIGGTADKAKASEAFPAMERVIAYPTTLFIDDEGEIRAIHTGFSGPATGDAHERMKERFERWIESALSKP